MLTQIIINDEYVFSLVHKVLAHCTACIRCNILHRAGFRSRRSNYDCIVHSTVSGKILYQRCYCWTFLSDCDIDTENIFSLLVNDRICCNGCLSCLTVADDQLTLSTTDRNHGVNCLDTSLQRLVYGTSLTDPRCLGLYRAKFFCVDRTCAVNRLSKSIDYSSDHRRYKHHRNTADHTRNTQWKNDLPESLYGIGSQITCCIDDISVNLDQYIIDWKHHKWQKIVYHSKNDGIWCINDLQRR